jgi:hypothetical protein
MVVVHDRVVFEEMIDRRLIENQGNKGLLQIPVIRPCPGAPNVPVTMTRNVGLESLKMIFGYTKKDLSDPKAEIHVWAFDSPSFYAEKPQKPNKNKRRIETPNEEFR